MRILNKRQLFYKQYGQGVGSVLKNIINSDLVKNSLKSLGKMAFNYIVRDRKMITGDNIKKAWNMTKNTVPNLISTQFRRVLSNIIDNQPIQLANDNTKSKVSEQSKDILNQLLYGDGILKLNKVKTF